MLPGLSVVTAHGLSCPTAHGIFPDKRLNPYSLHRQADSQPLDPQGSPGAPAIHSGERLGCHEDAYTLTTHPQRWHVAPIRRHTVCKSALETLRFFPTWRVAVVIKHKISRTCILQKARHSCVHGSFKSKIRVDWCALLGLVL